MDLKKTVKFKPTKKEKVQLPSYPPNQLQMWYDDPPTEADIKEIVNEKERENIINQLHILGLR